MRSRILSIILIFASILSVFAIPASADGDRVTDIYAKISDNGKYIEIKCTLSQDDINRFANESAVLYAVPPGKDIGPEYALTVPIRPRAEINASVDVEDNLSYSFVLAYKNNEGGYTKITRDSYITNPEKTALYTYEQPAVKSKKGLDFTMFADAQLCGVSHTVIEVPLNEYILTSYADTVSYRYAGKFFYFRKSLLSKLENQIKTYSEAGIRVYLNFVLTKHKDGQPDYLYYNSGSESASYYAFNAESYNACSALYAFTKYIAEKFTDPNSGAFCGNIIFGYEVNSNRHTNYAGPMPVSEYADLYAKGLRIVDCAARSVYSNYNVYTSLSNNFTKPSSDSYSDSTLDYSVADFLSHLSKAVTDGGDIPWRVSVDPYNIDRDKPAFYNLEGSEYKYDAKYLTMDNINILTSFLSQPAYLYNGQRRRVIIGEIGFNSGSGSEKDQKTQAASYCLAYYKTQANEYIDAIIYSAQTDDSAGGSGFGLYTKEPGTADTLKDKKSIYSVFKYIDTDRSALMSEPYLSEFGVSSWGEIVSGYDPSSLTRYEVIQGYGTTDRSGTGDLSSARITVTEPGNTSFYPSENTTVLEIVEDGRFSSVSGEKYAAYVKVSGVPGAEYGGMSAYFTDGVQASKKTKFALIDLCVERDSGEYADIILRITGHDENGMQIIYEGHASSVNNEAQRLYFNTEDFFAKCTDINRLSIWAKPHESAEYNEVKLYVNGVSLLTKKGVTVSSVVKTVIVIIICMLIIAGVAYLIMYIKLFRKYKKRKKHIEEKRRKV